MKREQRINLIYGWTGVLISTLGLWMYSSKGGTVDSLILAPISLTVFLILVYCFYDLIK